MKQTFAVGKRFKALVALAMILNISVVCVFYLIYRELLEPMYPQFVEVPLLVIFVGITALVIKATLYVSDWYAGTVCYRVGERELIVGSGRTERRYPWEQFSSVQMDSTWAYGLGTLVPISFRVGEKTLKLNQCVGDLYQLTAEIIKHIEPYVSVDPELKTQIEALKGTF
ncbi:MAG: hypothetical protein AB7E30_07325 [Lawsonibacter sp.]